MPLGISSKYRQGYFKTYYSPDRIVLETYFPIYRILHYLIIWLQQLNFNL